MAKAKRQRKVHSIKNELLIKSREAMLSAVQIFNNPTILFKSESFIVLSNIAWTYLLHAYYRENKVDYRYYQLNGQRKKYDKTKRGAYKWWELERCLNEETCPLTKPEIANLRFLIGLRHEIEHQMTNKIDDYLSARFQACCLNFNDCIKAQFGSEFGIDRHLSFSLQFSSITEDHANQLREFTDLPQNIASYINAFDGILPDEDFNNPRYSYRVLYVPKVVNKKGQADKVIEFIRADSPAAVGLNREYMLIKEQEKPKLLPQNVIDRIVAKGYPKFNMYQHTKAWKDLDAKNPARGFGVQVAHTWYWYDSWVVELEKYCALHKAGLI